MPRLRALGDMGPQDKGKSMSALESLTALASSWPPATRDDAPAFATVGQVRVALAEIERLQARVAELEEIERFVKELERPTPDAA